MNPRRDGTGDLVVIYPYSASGKPDFYRFKWQLTDAKASMEVYEACGQSEKILLRADAAAHWKIKLSVTGASTNQWHHEAILFNETSVSNNIVHSAEANFKR